jgi:hypothetical protein
MDTYGSSSFPRQVDSQIADPEETKNLGGAKGLRLIQIRLATSSLEKTCRLGKANCVPRISPTAVSLNLMDCSTLFGVLACLVQAVRSLSVDPQQALQFAFANVQWSLPAPHFCGAP